MSEPLPSGAPGGVGGHQELMKQLKVFLAGAAIASGSRGANSRLSQTALHLLVHLPAARCYSQLVCEESYEIAILGTLSLSIMELCWMALSLVTAQGMETTPAYQRRRNFSSRNFKKFWQASSRQTQRRGRP